MAVCPKYLLVYRLHFWEVVRTGVPDFLLLAKRSLARLLNAMVHDIYTWPRWYTLKRVRVITVQLEILRDNALIQRLILDLVRLRMTVFVILQKELFEQTPFVNSLVVYWIILLLRLTRKLLLLLHSGLSRLTEWLCLN